MLEKKKTSRMFLRGWIVPRLGRADLVYYILQHAGLVYAHSRTLSWSSRNYTHPYFDCNKSTSLSYAQSSSFYYPFLFAMGMFLQVYLESPKAIVGIDRVLGKYTFIKFKMSIKYRIGP